MAKAPTPMHLTASMRVLRAHRALRHIRIDVAQDEVKSLALRVARGTATEDDARLIAKLERACGCTLGELAVHAEGWPAD